VLTSAQLLADGLSDRGGFAVGYEWATEQLRAAGQTRLAAEVYVFWGEGGIHHYWVMTG
jgi:hypothetical protein